MRSPILLFTFLLVLPASSIIAQECSSGRFLDPVFPTFQRTNAIAFGSNVGSNGSQQTLYMDVYEPENDTVQERPVVLVAFGGSFVSGARNDVAGLCEEFAKRGYVAIAPDYRIGFFLPNSTSTMLAVMKGTHDMKACVRYLRKTYAEEENPWRIDPERIIVGGVSAGAISAIHATYLNDPSEFPPAIASLSDQVGGIEGLSGNEEYSSEVLACYNLSGAIGDTAWIDEGDPAIASVHEVGDQVVPYYTQEVSVFGQPTGLIASGSHDLHLRTEQVGIDHCLLTYPGNTHVGYIVSDPINSIGFIFEFCANMVCEQDAYCGAVTVGLEEIADQQRLDLFPNPATDQVTLNSTEIGTLSIHDMSGRMVMSARVSNGPTTLNVGHLPAGIYLIRRDGTGSTARLVIER